MADSYMPAFPPSYPVHGTALFNREADLFTFRLGWCHEFVQRFENYAELVVVLLLDLGQFTLKLTKRKFIF